ncbi:MAG TPA: hypothetical protein VKD04_02290 [Burkholderiales bacterium]|nr:hypothetical protein [Burkholderiales bacterium]
MNLRPAHAVIAVMAAVITLLSWALIYYSRDELGLQAEKHDDQFRNVSTADFQEGRPVVRLSAQSQKAAGIAVQTLKPAKRLAAFEAYGIVANLQPLAEMRGRYLAATAEARAARATLAAAESESRRMEMLFRDDRNVSEQAMKAAQARFQAELARQAAADQAAASIRDAIRGIWGETVTAWAVNPDSQTLRSLLQQKAFLVQLVLPHDLPRAAVRGRIVVAPAMARENSQVASFVAESPQIDPAFPGETYFYLVLGGGFRAGMRVAARVGMPGAPVSGVIVPAAAVVWHGGKAWAYVKEDEKTFSRHEVSTTDEMQGGWFNATGFDDDDEVVVSGAQLLLSEELKFQIRNENED